ncbi:MULTISPECIES: putative cyclic bacteriocin [Staphylococcus]|uniref:putative cyclic bacteriocin n=1 Tax=Staphylococcus TaxID=1279 RepID=UPI000D1B4CB4|nr:MULTISPECIES: putative cyclic bacteriocin [Staphylococcus]PTH05075.1 hypothetical protein BU615_11735 [Staphylococcus capitis]RIM39689.1 hypothetical protein BU617_10215 [Staphylococcus capitis]RIM45078.1 hypothetical protein BU620_10865 [Staphylococcus capitis]RIN12635.1 hypothetical protein BU086_07255 [Staphylococcus warneri]
MLYLVKKLKPYGITLNTSAASTIITSLITGADVASAAAAAGAAWATAGIGTLLSVVGRQYIMKFVKRWGTKKAAAW